MRKTEEKFGMVLLRNLAGALAIVWMCVIFAFSAQTKEESGAVSESFTYHMVSSTRSFFHLDLSDARVKEIADTIEGLVRKAAHMAEYGFLAVLLYIWIGQWEMSFLRRGGTAVGATQMSSISFLWRDARDGFRMCVSTARALLRGWLCSR